MNCIKMDLINLNSSLSLINIFALITSITLDLHKHTLVFCNHLFRHFLHPLTVVFHIFSPFSLSPYRSLSFSLSLYHSASQSLCLDLSPVFFYWSRTCSAFPLGLAGLHFGPSRHFSLMSESVMILPSSHRCSSNFFSILFALQSYLTHHTQSFLFFSEFYL